MKYFKEPQKNWETFSNGKGFIADYKPFTVLDGEGIRCSLYVSGCTFSCVNCYNKSIQNFKIGEKYSKELENKIIKDLDNSYVQGLSLLGGDPFLNTDTSLQLVTKVREKFGKSKDVWVWTGYTFESLLSIGSDKQKELLKNIDVLVDGPFINNLKDLSLDFRGSSNQRIINVKESLENNSVNLLF